MSVAKLNVKMFSVIPRALGVFYAACRQCFSPKFTRNKFSCGCYPIKKNL